MTHLPDDALQRLADSGAADPHLHACAACRDEVAAYRRLGARLAHLRAPAPPRDFAAGVMRAIAAREVGSPREIAAILAPALALLGALAWLVPLPSPLAGWHALGRIALAARVALAVVEATGIAPTFAAAALLLVTALVLRHITKEERA